MHSGQREFGFLIQIILSAANLYDLNCHPTNAQRKSQYSNVPLRVQNTVGKSHA